MAQVSMTVRMDANVKAQFDRLCQQFGMSTNAAVNVFANAVIYYRKIPFEIKAPDENPVNADIAAFYALREEARRNGMQDLSLDEINEEIRLYREEKKAKAAEL